MNSKINFIILFGISIVLIGCKKEGCTDEYAVNYDSQSTKTNDGFCIYNDPETHNYVPTFEANSATLMALDKGEASHYGKYGTYYSWSYSLAAKFSENGKNIVLAGDVGMTIYYGPLNLDSIYFRQLNMKTNFSYLINDIVMYGLPHYFPHPIKWRGSGAVWPAFNLTDSIGFSGTSVVQSGTPKLSSPYAFNVSSISDADSLVLQLIGQRNQITKVIPASASSHVFSQSEIESVGKGTAYLRVLSIRYDIQITGGRSYYLLNTKRSMKKVHIEE